MNTIILQTLFEKNTKNLTNYFRYFYYFFVLLFPPLIVENLCSNKLLAPQPSGGQGLSLLHLGGLYF